MVGRQIIYGITHEWEIENKLITYRVQSLDAAAMDRWNAHVIQMLRKLPDDSTNLGIIYDLMTPGVSLPFMVFNNYEIENVAVMPNSKHVVIDILAKKMDLTIFLALLVPNTMSGKITMARSRKTDLPENRVHAEIYPTYEAAKAWILPHVI